MIHVHSNLEEGDFATVKHVKYFFSSLLPSLLSLPLIPYLNEVILSILAKPLTVVPIVGCSLVMVSVMAGDGDRDRDGAGELSPSCKRDAISLRG